MKNHEYFVIWKLSEANIIIFSLYHYCILNIIAENISFFAI